MYQDSPIDYANQPFVMDATLNINFNYEFVGSGNNIRNCADLVNQILNDGYSEKWSDIMIKDSTMEAADMNTLLYCVASSTQKPDSGFEGIYF